VFIETCSNQQNFNLNSPNVACVSDNAWHTMILEVKHSHWINVSVRQRRATHFNASSVFYGRYII